MQTVVELPEFQKRSAELLVESECASIINYLAAHPLAGDIMQGTGGIRKRQQSLKIIDRTPQGPSFGFTQGRCQKAASGFARTQSIKFKQLCDLHRLIVQALSIVSWQSVNFASQASQFSHFAKFFSFGLCIHRPHPFHPLRRVA